MEQELIKKKREIIDIFLKKGILISSELLKEINDFEHISRIFDVLQSKQIDDVLIISTNLNNLISETKTQKIEDVKEEQQKHKIKVVYSYKEEPKKREPQDFVDYFNNRYKAIEKILKQRQELKNTVSINKIINKKEKENTSIIGIVSNKHVTKNGNLLLVLEDPTGQRSVLVNKNKLSLFNDAKDIV
ncbi:MAG: hypothetical protein AABX78_00880, partial [Nanoarchaeota archaeon]